MFVGDSQTLTVDTTPENLPLTFVSNNEAAATVDSDGVVTAVGPGSAKITASFEGNENYNAGSDSLTISVEPAHITGMTISEILAIGKDNLVQKANIYEVVGYVTEITNLTYGNIYIADTKGETDAANIAYVYGCSEDPSKLTWNSGSS